MGRSKRNAGSWLVTYSDLMTLLLVFFVLLYILTPGIDPSTFDNFITYFQRSVGVLEDASVVTQESSGLQNSRPADIIEMWQAFEQYLEERGLSDQVEIQQTEDGVKIILRDDLTFNSGSSGLLPEAREVLEEMSRYLGDDIAELEIQGHTDNVPISSGSDYRTNWHLGAARAVSVVLFLNERTPLAAGQYQAVSFGEYRPVAANETAEGRRQNRRVEIYVRYTELIEQKISSPTPRVPEPLREMLQGKDPETSENSTSDLPDPVDTE